jgi:hypothetical protein
MKKGDLKANIRLGIPLKPMLASKKSPEEVRTMPILFQCRDLS